MEAVLSSETLLLAHLLGLLFYPEDGSTTFFRNTAASPFLGLLFYPEDGSTTFFRNTAASPFA
jgi:hypothetical protein